MGRFVYFAGGQSYLNNRFMRVDTIERLNMKNFLAANDGTAVNSSHWEKLILSGPKYPLGKIELMAPVSETEIVILRNDMD